MEEEEFDWKDGVRSIYIWNINLFMIDTCKGKQRKIQGFIVNCKEDARKLDLRMELDCNKFIWILPAFSQISKASIHNISLNIWKIVI
jgi:hypothetical protein